MFGGLDMALTEEQKYRKKLARRLNRNMRALRKAGYTAGAIQEYEDFIEKFYPGRKGISETKSVGSKEMDLKSEISKLENMLSKKSATLRGMNAINRKRINTLKERFDIEFKSGNEIKNFFESELYEHMKDIYGSRQAIEIVSASKYSPEQVRERWEAHRTKTGKQSKSTKSLLSSLGFKDKDSMLLALAGVE